MRVFLLVLVFCSSLPAFVGCSESPVEPTRVRIDTVFVEGVAPIDTTNLADGEFVMTKADTFFIMKQYFMAFLDAAPNAPKMDSAASAEIQISHLAHLGKLSDEGKIDIVGPFGDDENTRGIAIYNVATLEEAQALADEDPAVKAGRLVVRIRPWWCAKGAKLN